MSAYDLVLVNSLDYGDLVNGVDYSVFYNASMLFIPHNYNYDILTLKIGRNRDVFYIEGNPISPIFANYTYQHNNVTLWKSNFSLETNHLFFQEIRPSKVVVVNYYYPDYVVSLFPFAIHNKVFILLTQDNVTQIRELIEEVSPQEIYMFGPLPTQVQDYLGQIGAIQIGTLGEDRYQDSISLFQRYYDPQRFGRMALMASGEELEESMVTNSSLPILLVGDIVPSTVYEFVKELAKNGTLKGVYIFERKLVTPVYNMKKHLEQQLSEELGREFKFGLLLKYGEAVPSQGGRPSPLGVFLLPIPASNLKLEDVIYDQTQNAIIFGLLNPTPNIEYLTIEGRLYVDGEQRDSFLTPLVRLDGGESRAVTVPLNISRLGSRNVTVEYIIRYGLYKGSLDKVITGIRDVVITNYVDPAQLNISLIAYDYERGELRFILENTGDVKAYAYPKLTYVEEGQTRVLKGVLLELEPGESIQQTFYVKLPEDMKNMTIQLEINYGSKPGLLMKTLQVDYMIKKEVPWILYLLIALLIIALIILLAYLLFFIFRKRKKKDDEE